MPFNTIVYSRPSEMLSCFSKRLLLVVVVLLAIVATGCTSMKIAREGDDLASRGAWDEAVLKYAEALSEDPGNIEFRIKYRRAKSGASRIHFDRGTEYIDEGNLEAALLEFKAAVLLDTSNKKAEALMRKTKRQIDSVYHYATGLGFLSRDETTKARRSFKKALALNRDNEAAAAELKKLKAVKSVKVSGQVLDLKSTAPISLRFKDISIKKIFRYLSEISGVNFIFDSDVRNSKATLYLKDGTFLQALDLLLMTNKLTKKVVSANTIVIYPTTPQKAKQYEDMLIKVFYLSNIDAKKAVNLLRTMIKARDLYVHSELNAIVVRARPEAIELAEKILAATDLADAEVILAVDILEVSRSKALNIGLDLSTHSVGAAFPGSGTPLESGVITWGDLKDLSQNSLLISLPSGIIDFSKEDLGVETLANPRIRVKNNAKARIHIGDKVPIITATVSGTAATTTESVQYQDVGLKLSVEPRINPDDEIDLKLSLEVSSLGTRTETNSGSVVYQIGTRNIETSLRLYDGETQVIGGLISDEERTTVVKIPGFGDIPILGRLFSSTDTGTVKTDILLSITPHIVRSLEVPDETVTEIWSGREDSPSGGEVRGGFAPTEGFRGQERPGRFEPYDEGDIPPPPPPGLFPTPPE